jgi:hypothetical protein
MSKDCESDHRGTGFHQEFHLALHKVVSTILRWKKEVSPRGIGGFEVIHTVADTRSYIGNILEGRTMLLGPLHSPLR